MKRPTRLWIGSIVLLLGLTLLPWILAVQFGPLRPIVFEETATLYFVTENAYFTREAALELSATSEMMTFPPEDLEPLPGDFDYTPPPSQTLISSSGDRGTRLVQFRIEQSIAVGISLTPLERYNCPLSSSHISGLFPPNQEFQILGWNVDLDNVTYLLISDNPDELQIWLRVPDLSVIDTSVNYLETPTIACRTYTTRATSITELPATVEVATNGSASITATLPLPQILSATPPPPVPVHLEITEEDAIQQVQDSVPELHNPQIEITPQNLDIQGYIDLPGPLGTTIKGDLIINADIVQEDTDLRVVVRSVTVAGRDITNTEDGQRVESTINNWVRELLVRRDVQSFEMLDGLLIIEVLERQFSIFPELPEITEQSEYPIDIIAPTETPTPSPTLTPTLIITTATMAPEPTQLPIWTQTPSATRTASNGG